MSSNYPFKRFDFSSIDNMTDYGKSMERATQSWIGNFQSDQQASQKVIDKRAKRAEILREAMYAESREERRRHDELVGIGREQVNKLEALLQDSKNAIEQRDALIRFVVQMMVNMESPTEEKKKTLGEVLSRLASIAAFGVDVSDLYKVVDEAMRDLAGGD